MRLPQNFQILKKQISTQTDNIMYKKSIATEKSTFFTTMSLKFGNPKFNILCKIALNIKALELKIQ